MRVTIQPATPLLLMVFTAVLACDAPAQRVRRSQPGMVRQTVAQTDITVSYNRPVARGRTLFGSLVDWGEIWNPGADEATNIEIADDVLVSGEPLPAGRYSLWVIPRETEAWTLIFSRAWDIWHVPYPGNSDDALRVDLEPESGAHMEVLAFYFPEVGRDRAQLVLHWGKTLLRVPLRLQ